MTTGEGVGKGSEEKQSRKEKTQAVEAGIAGEQINGPRIVDAKFGVEHDPREYDSHQRKILDLAELFQPGRLAQPSFRAPVKVGTKIPPVLQALAENVLETPPRTIVRRAMRVPYPAIGSRW
jgi:hypothetical protein